MTLNTIFLDRYLYFDVFTDHVRALERRGRLLVHHRRGTKMEVVRQVTPRYRARWRLGNRGFTALDVAYSLVITVILLSSAIPLIQKPIRHARVNRAARVVASDLRSAFSLAARQRRPVRMTFDASGRAYSFSDRRDATVLHSRTFDDDAEIPLSSMAASATSVDVMPNGVASAPISVKVGAREYTREITMMRGGLVRVLPR